MVTSDNLSGSDSGPNRIYTICSTYELQTILILNQKAVISDSARTHFNFETFYLFWILMMTLFSALTCLVTSLWRSEEYMYKIINVSSTYQPLKIPTFTKETTFFSTFWFELEWRFRHSWVCSCRPFLKVFEVTGAVKQHWSSHRKTTDDSNPWKHILSGRTLLLLLLFLRILTCC